MPSFRVSCDAEVRIYDAHEDSRNAVEATIPKTIFKLQQKVDNILYDNHPRNSVYAKANAAFKWMGRYNQEYITADSVFATLLANFKFQKVTDPTPV